MTAPFLVQVDSGAAVVGVLFALALLALQIYLIYAIIATRQDVKTIRELLHGSAALLPSGAAREPGAGFRSEDVDRLRQASDLRQAGILTDEEFLRVKEAILGGWTQPTSAVPPQRPSTYAPPLGAQYAVIIEDLGGADPDRVRKIRLS